MVMLPVGEGATAERWLEQRRRRRILYGEWKDDLYLRAGELVGQVRRDAWRFLDMSANPLRQLCDQFSTLYDREPQVRRSMGASAAALAAMEVALDDAGYWAVMQRVQRDTVGLRECFVRLDTADDGNLVVEQVFPDMVGQVAYDRTGRLLRRYEQLVEREDPTTQRPAWFWDVLEVTPDGVGRYRVVRDRGGRADGEDVSSTFLRTSTGARAPDGGLSGPDYPYLHADDTAYVPVARYRAAVLGVRHWDHHEWQEVVEGTLNVATYWSFWGHVLRAASWPQRYAVGLQPAGAGQRGGDQTVRHEVITDPATLLLLDRSEQSEGQPIVGQFSPGGDPLTLAKAVERYESRIAAAVGVSPSDLTRTSGDPRSGYALAVSREAQREQQARLKPAFRQGDSVALSIVASLLNGHPAWPEVPEDGWRPEYVALPRSADERRADREEAFELLDRQYIDEVEAMRRISGHTMSRAEAEAELARVRSEGEPELVDVPPDAPDAGNAPAPEEDVARTALNGAQVSSMQGAVQAAALGQLPRESVEGILAAAFPTLSTAEIQRILGPIGRGWEPTPDPAAPPPAAEQAPTGDDT